ncbi:MAG: recombination protein NinG [Thermodesulfovibrionales bacterium]|nr:recombination protein NinG [Thermodesulfovibrionales bacterium]
MARKAKTKGLKYWKKKAWDEFSKYVRIRDAINTTGTKTSALCFTCKKPYSAFGLGCGQAGHFVPGRTHALLFREKGVHFQCFNCNQTLRGNWVEYEREMKDKYGIFITEEEKQAKYSNLKYNAAEMQEIYEKYQQMYKELQEAR